MAPSEIEAVASGAAPEEEHFEVWPENWEAVQLFLRLSSQWRYGAMGGVIGLDYPSVESVMRMLRVKDKATMLDELQVMERAALEVLNGAG